MVAYELKRVNPLGLILAETLNGLDVFQRKQASLPEVLFFFKYNP